MSDKQNAPSNETPPRQGIRKLFSTLLLLGLLAILHAADAHHTADVEESARLLQQFGPIVRPGWMPVLPKPTLVQSS